MKKIFFILFLLILSLGMIGAAGTGQPDNKALVKRLMETSGMNDQIRQLPQVFVDGFSQTKGKLPPEVYNELEPETQKIWDTEKMIKGISNRIEKDLDAKTIQEILIWLDSDLGKKITALEKSASTPEEIRGRQTFIASLEKIPTQKKRQDLIQRWIKSTHEIEMATEVKMSTLSAVLNEVNNTLPEGKKADAETLKRQVENMRPKIEEESEKSVILSNLCTYRTLKDEEYQRYVEFAESDAGKRYHQVTMEAFKDEAKDAFTKFGTAVANVFKKFAPKEEKELTGEIVLNLKDGGVIRWSHYTEQEDRYCTYVSGGELCINKNEIARVEKY